MTSAQPRTQSALVVIDMQNCFFESPELQQERPRLIDACNELIEKAHLARSPVFIVRTQHKPDRSTWTRNMIDDNRGFAFEGDEDSLLLEEINDTAAIEVIKTRDDAFYRTDLEALLRRGETTQIVLAGVSTHSCVALTAAGAYARDFDVVLASDVIYSDKPELHKSTLDYLNIEYRHDVLWNQEISFVPPT